MLNKLILCFAIVALAMATAGTVTKIDTYRIVVAQPSVVKGATLKPGEYRLTVADSKVTLVAGKEKVEVPVKVETVEQKFDENSLRYLAVDGKQVLTEIRLGGTKTKLIFLP
jgi:hypothetical protein